MSKLCERPGCSEPGAAEYGMVPEDLLFWIAPLSGTVRDDQNVLCLRHADALTVPRGWTLDDRREEFPRLFRPRPVERGPAEPRRRRVRSASVDEIEQLVIDGTDEIPRPVIDEPESPGGRGDSAAEPGVGDREQGVDGEQPASAAEPGVDDGEQGDAAAGSVVAAAESGPWRPDFDHDNDLDGLLEVDSPLLARAFRGTDRRRG